MLEGDESSVRALFARITGDQRHKDVHAIWQGHEDARDFRDWSMGFRQVERPDLAGLGYRELATLFDRNDATPDPKNIVKKLLRIFFEGDCERY